MDQAFNEPYQGYDNVFESTRLTFEKSKNLAVDMLKESTKIDLKPTTCESGYFMAVDVTDARQHVPDKYFRPNENYEDDDATLVKQMQFIDNKVPLDFAVCRWLAVEKGVSLMPLSNFCLQESPHKLTDMARVAICKDTDTFKDVELISKFQKL